MLSVSRLIAPSTGSRPAEEARYSRQARPVVVWNVTASCPLKCAFCYNGSGAGQHPGELTTEEAMRVVDDLADFGVPAVVFSGGDPLARPDIFRLMERAASRRVRPVLSTSGVAIDRATARRMSEVGVLYAGVSLDGDERTNDELRGVDGAFRRALRGIRNCLDEGLTTGVRFTMNRKNVGDLPFIFGLIESEGIHRGYFAHLVWSGRGGAFSAEDLDHGLRRAAVDLVFDRAADLAARGVEKDIVTGSNDADGVYLYLRLRKTDQARAERVRALLEARGGNTSGVTVAAIDRTGEVHPDQFWATHALGSVRTRPFGEIWTDPGNSLLGALRDRKGRIKGRCARCAFVAMCSGGSRARAEAATGDAWGEDPSCYLTDEELGVTVPPGGNECERQSSPR